MGFETIKIYNLVVIVFSFECQTPRVRKFYYVKFSKSPVLYGINLFILGFINYFEILLRVFLFDKPKKILIPQSKI